MTARASPEPSEKLMPRSTGSGPEPMGLIYYTTHTYDPEDELRLAWDDPSIGFDWTTQNR